MGKYNVNGAYYHCAANGKDYSRDEWGKFCEDTRYTDAIVATYFGFRWNAHDVCLNPHTTEIYRDNRSFIEIKTAQRKDGLWTVGNSYQCLTGSGDDYGGGCGCWYDGATYETEEDARAEQDELVIELDRLLGEMTFKGKVALELGRGMVAGCGTYATGIVDTKRNETGNYAIVDGGKHQFVYYGNAMSMRQPPCTLIPERTEGAPSPWNMCGSLCTVTDILVKQLEVCEPQVGDVLCFGRAGAYCMTEGISLFLSRDLPSVIMCDVEGNLRLARKRLESWSLNTSTIDDE